MPQGYGTKLDYLYNYNLNAISASPCLIFSILMNSTRVPFVLNGCYIIFKYSSSPFVCLQLLRKNSSKVYYFFLADASLVGLFYLVFESIFWSTSGSNINEMMVAYCNYRCYKLIPRNKNIYRTLGE